MADGTGKRALIAGGSSGFGRTLTRAALARGMEVFAGARDPAKLDALQREATADFPDARLHVHPVDATDADSVAAWLASVRESADGLDLAICVVGKSERGNVLDLPPERLVDAFRVNVLPALLVAKETAELLAARRGTLVTIGSLASKMATPYLGAYPPAKFALAGLTQQLRWELEPRGVRTLFVAPGPLARADAGARYDAQAAELPEAARRPGGGAPVKTLDPDDLARRIFRAVERGDLELTAPSHSRWLFALWQIAPGLARRVLAGRLRR